MKNFKFFLLLTVASSIVISPPPNLLDEEPSSRLCLAAPKIQSRGKYFNTKT